jgi:hypothetical protein
VLENIERWAWRDCEYAAASLQQTAIGQGRERSSERGERNIRVQPAQLRSAQSLFPQALENRAL